MLDSLSDAIRSLWEVLLFLPMPWRTGLVVWICTYGVYRLARFLLPFVLLPEFWTTNRLRRWGRSPLPGAYAFGETIVLLLLSLRWLARLAIVVIIVGIIAWYARPELEGMGIARLIDSATAWWYDLEAGILSRG